MAIEDTLIHIPITLDHELHSPLTPFHLKSPIGVSLASWVECVNFHADTSMLLTLHLESLNKSLHSGHNNSSFSSLFEIKGGLSN